MAQKLSAHPIHLGKGASAIIEPDFTGDPDWYEAYVERRAADGAEGRLVALHNFSKPWDMWEMHPAGAEVVLCTKGEITLIQEMPQGTHNRIVLHEGEYAINPPGVWHTADVEEEASALFITVGQGTEHRER
ncbi:cupin domain-containing protein [Parasphingorhabdus sp.]|uniref:cupin domain-containing protein n=1 Tax=Parasphingorhabdus sp. TaxID=2709688 RepID=UPI002F94F601